MKIELKWSKLIQLRDASKDNLIYGIDAIESIPKVPGIYVFGRKRGEEFIPIYIGQALRLGGRIRRQLNNVRLMMELKAASGRKRFITYAEFIGKPGQETSKALNTIERSLIKYALAKGYDILNVMGTKRREHVITSKGSSLARAWMPREMYVEKRRR